LGWSRRRSRHCWLSGNLVDLDHRHDARNSGSPPSTEDVTRVFGHPIVSELLTVVVVPDGSDLDIDFLVTHLILIVWSVTADLNPILIRTFIFNI
jgi:hypothetical protein